MSTLLLPYVECECDLRLLTTLSVDWKWLCRGIMCNRPQWLNSIQGLKALEISYLIYKRCFCLMPPSLLFFFSPKLAFSKVENDPHLKLMYTECLRLCGTWLAETCLENPTVIMQKYLEKVHPVFEMYNRWDSAVLKCQVDFSLFFCIENMVSYISIMVLHCIVLCNTVILLNIQNMAL